MYLLRIVYAMKEVIRPQTFTITECHKTFYQRYIYSVFHDMPDNIKSTIQCLCTIFFPRLNDLGVDIVHAVELINIFCLQMS